MALSLRDQGEIAADAGRRAGRRAARLRGPDLDRRRPQHLRVAAARRRCRRGRCSASPTSTVGGAGLAHLQRRDARPRDPGRAAGADPAAAGGRRGAAQRAAAAADGAADGARRCGGWRRCALAPLRRVARRACARATSSRWRRCRPRACPTRWRRWCRRSNALLQRLGALARRAARVRRRCRARAALAADRAQAAAASCCGARADEAARARRGRRARRPASSAPRGWSSSC